MTQRVENKMSKTEQQLNVLAQNMGTKLATLEGEKAILQVEIQELNEYVKQISEELQLFKKQTTEEATLNESSE